MAEPTWKCMGCDEFLIWKKMLVHNCPSMEGVTGVKEEVGVKSRECPKCGVHWAQQVGPWSEEKRDNERCCAICGHKYWGSEAPTLRSGGLPKGTGEGSCPECGEDESYGLPVGSKRQCSACGYICPLSAWVEKRPKRGHRWWPGGSCPKCGSSSGNLEMLGDHLEVYVCSSCGHTCSIETWKERRNEKEKEESMNVTLRMTGEEADEVLAVLHGERFDELHDKIVYQLNRGSQPTLPEHTTKIEWTPMRSLGSREHLTEGTQQLYTDLKRVFPINKVPESVVATFLELEKLVTEAEKKFEVLLRETQEAVDSLEEDE